VFLFFKKIGAFTSRSTATTVGPRVNTPIFYFAISTLAALLLTGCNTPTEEPSTPLPEKPSPSPSLAPSNPDSSFLIPLDAWEDLGKPLFDVEAYYDRFYVHPNDIFEITNRLQNKASEFLQPLSKSDFITLYQDVLHPSLTREDNSKFRQQRIMYKEYLYTHEDSFIVEINRRGQGRILKKPKSDGYVFDFITTYTSNPSDNFYQINALFFEKSSYGSPKKWDDWYGIVTKGHIMCCATPTALATYHKTDSSEYTAHSKLLKFPYFKRTEVYKTIQNNYISRIDSTIYIFKFGFYTQPSYCDEKKFINGRLVTSFWDRRLRRRLRY